MIQDGGFGLGNVELLPRFIMKKNANGEVFLNSL